MFDPFQAQEDFYMALLSAGQFKTVNVVNERRFIQDSKLEQDSIWSLPRNGKYGNGILAEELIIENEMPNAPAPILKITFPIVCFQNGDAAFVPDLGSGFKAQNLGMMVMDLFYQWSVDGAMVLFDGRSWERAKDFPYVNAIRVSPKIGIKASALTRRAAYIVVANDEQQVSLSCVTPGAKIVYTLDGSFPADPEVAFNPITDKPVNPNATIYTGPFQLEPDQIVRAIAYADGLNMGPTLKFHLNTQ